MPRVNLDRTGLTQYLTQNFTNFAQARGDIETKWNTNRDDFFQVFKQLWKKKEGEDWRSKATAGLVSQKVRALYSIIVDVYLQGGRIPVTFLLADKLLKVPPGELSPYRDDLELAGERVAQAFDRCHAERAFMDNAFAACMYGSTRAKVIRQTFNRTKVAPSIDPAMAAAWGIDPASIPWIPQDVTEEGNAWEYVSNWSLYGDPEAAFHCRRGSMVYQLDLVSPYHLRQQMGKSGSFYIDDELEAAIAEAAKEGATGAAGVSDNTLPPYLRTLTNRKRTVRWLECWGRVPIYTASEFMRETLQKQNRIDLESVSARMDGDVPWSRDESDGREVYVHAIVAGERIVRFALVDPRDNPFYEADLEHIPDENSGRGVADNAKMGQDLASAGLRSFIDNKAWSANVQLAMKRSLFRKVPDAIEPGAKWYLNEEAKSARDGIEQIIVQDVGESLLSLIGLGEKYCDWDSMMAKAAQGQFDMGYKKLATEIIEQTKKSDTYTGGCIRNLDEGLTEPIAERFYLDDVSDPDLQGGKGDFVAQALGFETYQTNQLQLAGYLRLLDLLTLNPVIAKAVMADIKVKELIDPVARKLRVDPRTFWKSPEEKARDMALQAQQMALQARMQPAQNQQPVA